MPEFLHAAGPWVAALLYALIALLCLAGLLLSALTISGTWLVAAAALVALLLPGEGGPGWGLPAVFLAVALAVEGAEFLAGAWGVSRRGGSRAAGWAAIGGGLLGLVLGSFLPPPLIGNLVGMLAGSFALVYWVEKRRLQQADRAAHIAWGTVLARVAVLLLKVGVTFGMVVALGVALARGS